MDAPSALWVQDGAIVCDEEHHAGARICLERRGTHIAPLAITCGIYGLFFHTCFFATEDEAQEAYSQMKADLARILELPDEERPGNEAAESEPGESNPVLQAISAFVERFPT